MLRDYYGRAPPSFFDEPHEFGFGQLTSSPALRFSTAFSGGRLIPRPPPPRSGSAPPARARRTDESSRSRRCDPWVASSGLRWQGLRGAALLGPLDSLACDRQP